MRMLTNESRSSRSMSSGEMVRGLAWSSGSKSMLKNEKCSTRMSSREMVRGLK